MKALTPENLRCPTTGKRMFVNEEEGNAAIEAAWKNPDWEGINGKMPVRVYPCPDCGWWHFSSSHLRTPPRRRERPH